MTHHYLKVWVTDSKEPMVEEYPAREVAQEALKAFIDAAGSDKSIIASTGGGIAIRRTHFKSAQVTSDDGPVLIIR